MRVGPSFTDPGEGRVGCGPGSYWVDVPLSRGRRQRVPEGLLPRSDTAGVGDIGAETESPDPPPGTGGQSAGPPISDSGHSLSRYLLLEAIVSLSYGPFGPEKLAHPSALITPVSHRHCRLANCSNLLATSFFKEIPRPENMNISGPFSQPLPGASHHWDTTCQLCPTLPTCLH